jgi:hypothetical protein
MTTEENAQHPETIPRQLGKVGYKAYWYVCADVVCIPYLTIRSWCYRYESERKSTALSFSESIMGSWLASRLVSQPVNQLFFKYL